MLVIAYVTSTDAETAETMSRLLANPYNLTNRSYTQWGQPMSSGAADMEEVVVVSGLVTS